jgi:hypothetical protein
MMIYNDIHIAHALKVHRITKWKGFDWIKITGYREVSYKMRFMNRNNQHGNRMDRNKSKVINN